LAKCQFTVPYWNYESEVRNKAEENSGNRSVGCSGYDIYRAELPFHFWLVITIEILWNDIHDPGHIIIAMTGRKVSTYTSYDV
jgi:hypothetical protein